MKKILIIITLLLFINPIQAQTKLEYQIETHNHFSNKAPFWLISNQNGRYSTEDINSQLNCHIQGTTRITSKVSLSYRVEALVNNEDVYHNGFRFFQYYANINTAYLDIKIGKQYNEQLNFERLKSGQLLNSSNAEPIPKVQLKTPDYIPFLFIQDYFDFKAMMAHGWFESQRFVESPYLHEKYVYLKVKNILPIEFYIGLQHAAMWGGNHPVYGKLPDTWSVFKDIFLAKAGNDETSPVAEEQENRTGNHIGMYDLGLNYKYNDYSFTIYRQVLFEDASGKSIQFFSDGLWGIEIKLNDDKALLNGLVFEFIKTDYQSGPVHDLEIEPRLFGKDNYFNNFLYTSGWSYYGFTIGNPFITSPIFNFRNSLTTKDGNTIVSHFPNNRLLAWHVGLMGALSEKVNYRWLLSYSLNYGYYYSTEEDYNEKEVIINGKSYIIRELPGLKQFSTMFELEFPVTFLGTELQAKTAIAADFGEFLGDRYGLTFSLSKTGLF